MDNEIRQKQLSCTSQTCLEFEQDGSAQEAIDILREMLRMKEEAAVKLESLFTSQIMALRECGISDISVLGIAEALENELVTNLGEMEVIAERLAVITRMDDIREAYGNISDRILKDVGEMIEGMRRDRTEALDNEEAMQRIEWAETVERLVPVNKNVKITNHFNY